MSAPHPDNGTWIRLLDGESSAQERATLERHRAECEACAGRWRMLRDVSQAIASALAAADPPTKELVRSGTPRPGGPRVAWWRTPTAALRAAAVLLAFSAVVASAQPVRRWIVAQWERLREAREEPSPAAVAPPGRAGAVHFTPVGRAFTIEVVAAQAVGALSVELVSDSIAWATVNDGDGSEELVVLPQRLRIVNQSASRASYQVGLPGALGEVRIRVGDAVERRLVAVAGARWTIELRRD